jgi:lipopolysaccharide biosynthesis glycosyltransferase
MDIRELWDVSMEGRSFAGALDVPHGRFSPAAFKMRLMGSDRRIYVNSGVLLMNLSRIREKYRLIQQYASWMKRYPHCCDALDQDFINSCFQSDIKILEGRFNNTNAHRNSSFNDVDSVSNSMLHAISGPKPGTGLRGSSVDRLYWKFFLKTPWGRLPPEELMDLMIDMVQKSPATHRRTAQCYANAFHRLRKDVLCENIFLILRLLAKDLYYRIKRAFAR